MTIKNFKTEKLIRDKIPALLESKGIRAHTKKLTKTEYLHKLKDKLIEEAKEVSEAISPNELSEELCDVLEVVHALAKANGLTMQEIEQRRLKKREIKGGFEERTFASFMKIEERYSSIDPFSKKPQHDPETQSCTYQSNCLFCQIARKEKEAAFIANFAHCYVIKDQFPVSKGHLLIIPHEHTENWFTAKEEVRLDLIKALHQMKEQLDKEYSPHGYNIGANCGEVAGQSVMHLHLHLIPRYQGDMDNPKGGVRGVIPSKQKY